MQRVFLILLGAWLCWLPPQLSSAETQPLRLAVVLEGVAAPLGDLMTAELSAAPALQVVDRAELDRLAGEASLAALGVAQRPLALARLARADALLLVSMDVTDAKRPLLYLRLTAVGDGTVRHGIVLPWVSAELPATARLAYQQLREPLAQMRVNTSQAPRYVTWQGLRSTVANARSAAQELALNTLLAHRLTKIPGVVLLERWRMDDLVFERALQAQPLAPFQTGAMLVDGSFSTRGSQLIARVRMRASEADPGQVREVSAENEAALAEAILQTLGETFLAPNTQLLTWKPEEEARAFAELGDWLNRFNLPAEAAQALETAVALGLHTPAVRGSRVWAYGQCAYPDATLGYGQLDHAFRPETISRADELPYRLAAAQRACEYALDILAEGTAISDASAGKQPASLGILTFYKTVRVLRATVALHAHHRHAEPVRALRSLAAQLVELLDRSAVKSSPFYLNYKAAYAAYWCASPDATLAYYRTALAPGYSGTLAVNVLNFSTEVRDTMLDAQYSPPYLDRAPAGEVETRRLGPDRLVEWQTDDLSGITGSWRKFLAELKSSQDLTSQADSLGFALASSVEPANRRRMQAEMAEWLETHRQAIARTADSRLYASIRLDYPLLTREPAASTDFDRVIAFLVAALDQAPRLPVAPFQWLQRLTDNTAGSNLKPEHIRQLADALQRYRERGRQDSKWTQADEQQIAAALVSVGQPAAPSKPAATVSTPKETGGMPVTSAWVPARRLPVESSGSPVVTLSPGERPLPQGKRVFFNHPRGVVGLDLETLQSTLTPPLPGQAEEWRILPTTRQIWAAGRNSILRISRESGAWTPVKIPPAAYDLRSAGEQVWAIDRSANGPSLHELIAADSKLVFSAKRHSSRHPLDVPFSDITGVFAGPGQETTVGLRGESGVDGDIFHVLARPTERLLHAEHWLPAVKTDGETTLLIERASTDGSAIAGIWLVRPGKSEPELLLHDAGRSRCPVTAEPRWKVPPEFGSPAPGMTALYSAVYRHNELWILRRGFSKGAPGTAPLELFGFLPGYKSPRFVPLQLIPSPVDLEALQAHAPLNAAEAMLELPASGECLTCTEFGLLIGGSRFAALWVIPWEELHAWVKLHR